MAEQGGDLAHFLVQPVNREPVRRQLAPQHAGAGGDAGRAQPQRDLLALALQFQRHLAGFHPQRLFRRVGPVQRRVADQQRQRGERVQRRVVVGGDVGLQVGQRAQDQSVLAAEPVQAVLFGQQPGQRQAPAAAVAVGASRLLAWLQFDAGGFDAQPPGQAGGWGDLGCERWWHRRDTAGESQDGPA